MNAVRSGQMKKIGMLLVVSLLHVVGCSTRPHGEGGVTAGGLTPTQWASLSRPGASHKLLEPFIGEWSVEMTFWSSPDSKGESSRGTSRISWVLGKRFVEEQFKGEAAGAAFEGLGIMGYDNGSRTFSTVWIDSLNTALTTATGRYVPDQNAFELVSQLYDPLLSRAKTVHSTLRFSSPDSYVFTMTDESPEGKRFTSLEMIYRRKRS